MNGCIVDKMSVNDCISDLRYSIARAFNCDDSTEFIQWYHVANTSYAILEKLDLLTDSQKVNFKADITDMLDIWKL